MKKRKFTSLKNRIMIFFMIATLFPFISGCGKEELSGEIYQVYYISSDESSIVPIDVGIELTETGDIVTYLIECLSDVGEAANMLPVLSETTGFSSVSLQGFQVTVDFNETIMQLPNYDNVLIRAALTRTLTQVKGVNTVCCTVNGAPMLDSMGMPIGPMTANTFIENAGTQINPDENTVLNLYFASEDGNSLVKVKRNVTYNSNISLDKLVVEQLLLGPIDGEIGMPVMNTDTKVMGVTTQDGTCYVNLNSAFLNSNGNITTDVAIYSIVDSLIELGNINKVQFYIDGEADVTFRETVNFTTQFSRNLDLVIQ